LSSLALRSISGYLPLWLRHRAPGTLSALNGSFRRILRVEDKSERTVKSYTVLSGCSPTSWPSVATH
jgi:hypothetical protein